MFKNKGYLLYKNAFLPMFSFTVVCEQLRAQPIKPDLVSESLQIESQSSPSPDRQVIWKGLGHQLTVSTDQMNLIPNSYQLSVVKYAPDQIFLAPVSSWPGFIREYHLDEVNLAIFSPKSMFELDRLSLKAHKLSGLCGSIETLNLINSITENTTIYPSWYHSRVYFDKHHKMLQAMSVGAIKEHIESISKDFQTRFHSHRSGIAFTAWLESKFNEILGDRDDVIISQVSHSITQQKSLVVKVSGTEKADETVIVGAHLDSIAQTIDDAPGADDNAAGVASLLNLAQIIATSNLTFARSIELHAYAAEEIGLIGSRDIAQRYQKDGKKVVSMMQIDMAAYSTDPSNSTIYLISNDSSYEQRRMAKDFMQSYKFSDFKVSPLSGGTSDHKAWHERGYPSLFAFEDPDNHNPHIHTSNDTTTQLNNDQLLLNINKLALTNLVYAAGLKSYQESYNELKNNLWADSSVTIRYYIGPKLEDMTSAFWFSVDKSVSQIDICEVTSKDASSCKTKKLYIDNFLENENFRFFDASSKVDLKANMILRVEAYKGENIVGHRHLSFQ